MSNCPLTRPYLSSNPFEGFNWVAKTPRFEIGFSRAGYPPEPANPKLSCMRSWSRADWFFETNRDAKANSLAPSKCDEAGVSRVVSGMETLKAVPVALPDASAPPEVVEALSG